MTKMNWDKADQYVPDPGAVVSVPDAAPPSRWVPPGERERRRAEYQREEKDRADWFRLLSKAVRIERFAKELEERLARGEQLSFWNRGLLTRWNEIRWCLDPEAVQERQKHGSGRIE